MKLLLDLPAFHPTFKIEHHHQLFFIGSCFSEHMASYFEDRKFSTLRNPFGVIYNPVSIANSLRHIRDQKQYEIDTFYTKNDLTSSWDHHSKFATLDPMALKENVEKINESSLKFLQKTDVAFITLGTAWVYEHKENQRIVANNHQAPQEMFKHKLLSIHDIKEALQVAQAQLKSMNPDIKIILALSPVRHSKQGLVENNRSKARLLEGIHAFCETDQELFYFPSYEIILDVLRDYRFYTADFVHPNKLATDFLWSFIQEHFIQPKAYPAMKQSLDITQATKHKLMHPDTAKAKQFKATQLAHIAKLKNEYPYMDLEKEQAYFESL